MEPLGLAISLAQLLSMFKSCLDLYSLIRAQCEKNDDLLFVATKLEYERNRSARLQLFFSSMNSDEQPSQETASYRLIANFLRSKETTLQELDELIKRHGVDKTKPNVVRKSKNFATWVANDKARVIELVMRLKVINEDLTSLIPRPVQLGMEFHLIADSVAPSDAGTLLRIHDELGSQYAAVRTVCKLKALRMDFLNGTGSKIEASPDFRAFQLRSARDIKWARLTKEGPWTTFQHLEDVIESERAMGLIPSDASKQESDRPIMVEWRNGFRSQTSTVAFENRLDELVYMLQKIHQATVQDGTDRAKKPGIDIHILDCLGWIISDASFSRIGLVFALPAQCTPISLNDLIQESRKKKLNPPDLGTRFEMARTVAFSLANFIAIGWRHKAVRSHNVLIFDKSKVTQLFLVGFSYARPGKAVGRDLTTLPHADASYQLYRPPTAQLSGLRFDALEVSEELMSNDRDLEANPILTASYDIFGMGMILLELGLWRTIDSVREDMPHHEFLFSTRLRNVTDSLSYRCGKVYRDVVRRCFVADPALDDGQELFLFLENILVDLSKCTA